MVEIISKIFKYGLITGLSLVLIWIGLSYAVDIVGWAYDHKSQLGTGLLLFVVVALIVLALLVLGGFYEP